MCCRGQFKEVIIDGKSISIDECIADKVKELNNGNYRTIGSCCGHGKYPPTIILQARYEKQRCTSFGEKPLRYEYYSGKIVNRKSRFFKIDENGDYAPDWEGD